MTPDSCPGFAWHRVEVMGAYTGNRPLPMHPFCGQVYLCSIETVEFVIDISVDYCNELIPTPVMSFRWVLVISHVGAGTDFSAETDNTPSDNLILRAQKPS